MLEQRNTSITLSMLQGAGHNKREWTNRTCTHYNKDLPAQVSYKVQRHFTYYCQKVWRAVKFLRYYYPTVNK